MIAAWPPGQVKTRPLILSRHIVMPISPLILFPVPEKKNKAKIKRVLVDSKKPIKKKKRKKEIFSRIYRELTVV